MAATNETWQNFRIRTFDAQWLPMCKEWNNKEKQLVVVLNAFQIKTFAFKNYLSMYPLLYLATFLNMN